MDEKNENECENEEKAGDKSSLSLYFSLCLCDHKGRKIKLLQGFGASHRY